jgi:5-methylthioribose kinase
MSGATPRPLLTSDVLDHLRARNIAIDQNATVTPLEEGVSARVYLVESSSRRLVVKQALPELNVAGAWSADPARALTEGRALTLAGSIIPGSVPEVLDIDADLCAITMTAAPAAWVNWRRTLLDPPRDAPAGDVAADIRRVASGLGERLGYLHHDTWGDAYTRASFNDDAAFEDLRVSPYHRVIIQRNPATSSAVEACIRELLSTHECLVHGDFSPKNILYGSAGMWILDFEVARYGASVFDVAFLCHHLALKAIVNPDFAPAYRDAFNDFLGEYRRIQPHISSHVLLGWHAAALLLARVDGLSPANYLSDAQRKVARSTALELLAVPSSIQLFWELVAPLNNGRQRS